MPRAAGSKALRGVAQLNGIFTPSRQLGLATPVGRGPAPLNSIGQRSVASGNTTISPGNDGKKASRSLLVPVLGVGGVAAATGVLYAYQSGQQSQGLQEKFTGKPQQVEAAVKPAVTPAVPAVTPAAPAVVQQELRAKPSPPPESDAERAAREAREAEEARAALQAKEALEKAKAALEQAQQVTSGVCAAALQQAEMDRLASIQRREAAKAALQAALESRNPTALVEAVEAAKVAGLGASVDLALAESLAAPARLLALNSSDAEASIHQLLQLPSEFHGLNEEQAESSERERCKNMNRAQLQARVEELTRHLATARLHAKARLEQALLTQLEAADLESLRALGEALRRAAAEHDERAAERIKECEAQLLKRQEEAVAEATAAAIAEANELREAERNRLMEYAREISLQVRSERIHDVVALRNGLEKLEQVLVKDEEIMKRAHSYNSLSAALLSLEDAILGGRGAAEELQALRKAASDVNDEFVTKLLIELPQSAVALCSGTAAIPTEPLLKHRLASSLDELAAAAFVPPNSGLLGEVIGIVFGRLYVLGGLSAIPTLPEASETSRNLATLSMAKAATESAGPVGLRTALTEMENQLRGPCRERASALLNNLRAALQLRQTLSAMKARVQCLNSTLT